MKRIIYTAPDGQLCVVTPVINTVGEREGFTEDDALARALRRIPGDATDVNIIDLGAIPADRSYRDAWKHDGNGGIIHDMDKAREIHRRRLRALRQPLLVDLDIQYMKADEAGDTQAKKTIAEKKKALRDCTDDPLIHSAKTIEELRSAIPAVLEGME